jgi:hypothetical protein
MVSAGLDTVPGNLIMGIAYLSSPHGQEIQSRAYDEIMKVYPDGDAWSRCLTEEKVPYVTAFVREVLRFFTVIPICLPRQSIKDIKYEQAVIPAGTMFYMVGLFLRLPPSHLKPCLERYTDNKYRMHGQQTTTQRISNNLKNSQLSGILTHPKAQEHRITPTAPVRVCVLVLISQTENSTQLLSDFL